MKDISISEDAYEMLNELRGEASYSDVIRQLGRRDDIAQFAGAFPEIGAVADDLEAERKNFESRWSRSCDLRRYLRSDRPPSGKRGSDNPSRRH